MTAEQESLLALFNRIADYLESEGIRYYLLGGSAIGALRHRGFIPWDDDIDIMVEMDDYQKLLSRADDLPWDDIEMVSNETDPLYFRPYARFSHKKETMFMKGGIFNHGKGMGTLIDVVPLYDVPSSMMEEFSHDFLLYQEIVTIATTYRKDIYKYKEEYLKLREREKTEGRTKIVSELREKLLSYSEHECDRKVVGLWGFSKLRDFDAAWFSGEPRYLPFEGRLCPVPSGVEACLRYQYGFDWYILPESREWIDHRFYRDTEISFNNYFIDLSNFADWEEADRDLEERKRTQIDRLDVMAEIDVYKALMLVQREMMRNGISAGDLHADALNGAYREIEKKIHPLVSAVKGLSGIAPDIAGLSEEDIEAAIKALIYTGKYYDAVRLIRAFDHKAERETEELLSKTLKLCEAYQDKDDTGLQRCLAVFTKDELSSLPDCITACARCFVNDKDSPLTGGEIMSACDGYLSRFPDNSDVRKSLADIYLKTGCPERAEELYREVLLHSRNGLDLLEVRDILNDQGEIRID